MQQQQAEGATLSQIRQTQTDTDKLEKMLTDQQKKLQKNRRSPALQKVIEKTRAEMNTPFTQEAVDSALENAYNINTQINENSAEPISHSEFERIKCRNEGLEGQKQLAQIENEEIPDGYTWHHEVETGIMRLVDSNTHEKTGHTGGRYFWGGGTDNR